MLFHIHILMRVGCIHSISPLFSAGGNNFQSQVLKRRGGQKKNDCLGDLKNFCHAEYLPGGLAMFLVKKKTFKDKIWPLVLNFKC